MFVNKIKCGFFHFNFIKSVFIMAFNAGHTGFAPGRMVIEYSFHLHITLKTSFCVRFSVSVQSYESLLYDCYVFPVAVLTAVLELPYTIGVLLFNVCQISIQNIYYAMSRLWVSIFLNLARLVWQIRASSDTSAWGRQVVIFVGD